MMIACGPLWVGCRSFLLNAAINLSEGLTVAALSDDSIIPNITIG
jgi:hypothetical protein